MNNYFRNKKILVTGADGFIGSHLVEKLVKLKSKVTALCYYNSFNYAGWLENYNKSNLANPKIVFGDVRDFKQMNEFAKRQDIIFHLASLIGIPYSYKSPKAYIDTNLIGTYNILEAARLNSINKIYVTSTSEVYGNASTNKIDETHELKAQSPYSASKIAADKLAESYYLSYNLPVTVIRPFNTYGPRQSMRAVIPTIISQILSKNKKIQLGNVNTLRDFNYIDDTINGFLSIAQKKSQGQVINICSGQNISIVEIVNLIKKILNSKIKISFDKKRFRPTKSEVDNLIGNNEKIYKFTGWKSKTSLEIGLKKTINWFKKNQAFKGRNNYNI